DYYVATASVLEAMEEDSDVQKSRSAFAYRTFVIEVHFLFSFQVPKTSFQMVLKYHPVHFVFLFIHLVGMFPNCKTGNTLSAVSYVLDCWYSSFVINPNE